MKPSIDEQIEAVENAMRADAHRCWGRIDPKLEAALSTLRWVKRYAKPSLDALMAEFPGARVKQREEE